MKEIKIKVDEIESKYGIKPNEPNLVLKLFRKLAKENKDYALSSVNKIVDEEGMYYLITLRKFNKLGL